ncbi:carboxypeptidase regulatory-like domain-containing protein [Peribacillus sp. SCS-155]|uniref:hemoblobin-interacting domain-containing protein n=1 Tax=Peribacillus sedimenti TaxID=3115297 RepID=UPI003906046C
MMKNRFPYSKKFIAAALAVAVAVPSTAALASIIDPTDGKGDIELKVLDDDKKSVVNAATVTIKDSNGATVTAPSNQTVTDNSGTFKSGALAPGVYTLQVSKGSSNTINTKVTVKEDKTGKSPSKATLVLVEPTTASPATTGLLSDVVYAADGTTPLAGVTVKASNGTTTWETTTAATTGKFELFVPAGKYNLTVEGKDIPDNTGTVGVDESVDYKNMVYSNLVVTAGQKTSPFATLKGEEAWAPGEAQLGYSLDQTLTTASFDVALLTGKANPDTKVSVYEAGNPKKLIASTVAKKAKTGGTFNIKLPYALGGKTIIVEAEDKAGNTFSSTPAGQAINLAPALTFTADNTANNFDKPIDITFTDTTKLFAQSITKVTVNSAVLKNKIDYTASNGKITIKAGKLPLGSNTIAVEANGFTNATAVTQVINAAELKATPVLGTTAGVKFYTVPASGNKLMYQVLTDTIAAPQYLSAAPASPAAEYITGADITGVNTTTNKYVALYEVDSNNKVIKFKVVTLTSKVIK